MNRQNLTCIRFLALIAVIFGLLLMNGCGSAAAEKKGSKDAKESKTEVERSDEKDDPKSDPDDEEHPSDEEDKADSETDKEKDGDKKESPHGGDEKSKGGDKKEKVAVEPIWNELMKGNKLFMSGKYSAGNFMAERSDLAKGQKPKVIILACSDSRVPPELVFGKNTGDIFVVRNAGNIVDEIALGSMEYAVEHLHSSVIVVLGHESCGAVAATLAGEKMPSRNLQAIVDTISPVFESSQDCPIGSKINLGCVELNVNQTAKHLTSKSKILKEAIDDGRLAIVKAVYKLDTGEVAKIK